MLDTLPLGSPSMSTVTASAMKYTVVGFPPTRTIRIIWALEELGLPYDIDPARPHTDSINQVNPAGKVPALRVAGDGNEAPFEVIDSVAILHFLADRHQQLTYPAGSSMRAIQDSFTHFACDELDGTLWQMAKHSFIWPEELRNFDAIKGGCTHDLDRAYKTLAARLGNNQYVMGDEFTIPDIIITHCCGWAERSKYQLAEPSIEAYLSRCQARSAYEKTMEVRSQYL